jgi:branched-subunit amino acid transport protein
VTWTAILLLAAGAYLGKAAGLLLGPRLAIARIERWLVLLPVAVLSALVVVQTFDGGRALVIDARLGGVAVGAIAAWRRVPFAGVVVVAAMTTALIRAA